jgi:uncharacterized protein (UPF0335 family)
MISKVMSEMIKVDNDVLGQLIEKIVLDDDDKVLTDGIKQIDQVARKCGMDMSEMLRQILIKAIQSGKFGNHKDIMVVNGDLYVKDE